MSHKNKVMEELRSLNVAQLQEKIGQWRQELFVMRIGAATNPVKDSSRFKKLRGNIARGMFVIRETAFKEFLKQFADRMEQAGKEQIKEQSL